MCGPGAVKWSAARPGATIRRAIVAPVRRWTGARGRTPVRAVDVRNRAWVVLRGAQALSAAAVADTKAAGDAKGVVAINDEYRRAPLKGGALFAATAARAERTPAAQRRGQGSARPANDRPRRRTRWR